MIEDSLRSTSRRSFVKYATLSTGTLIGASSGGVNGETAGTQSNAGESNTAQSAGRGLMRPYQFTPETSVSVVESELDWRPAGLEESHRTHVVAYDHAPSLRAFLFTDREFEPADSLELGTIEASTTPDGLVAVELEREAEESESTD